MWILATLFIVIFLLLMRLLYVQSSNSRLHEIIIFQSIMNKSTNQLEKMQVSKNIWNQYFEIACSLGDKPTIDVFIEKGATCWNHGLRGAAIGNRIDIVRLMINKGAKNINESYYLACKYGSIDVLKQLQARFNGCFIKSFKQACLGKKINAAHYLLNKINIGKAMEIAVFTESFDVAHYLLLAHGEKTFKDWVEITNNSEKVRGYLNSLMRN